VKRARAWLLVLLALAAVAMLCPAATGVAQPVGLARESAVKAAFLFKFASFVDYPQGTFRSGLDPFVIAVYGDDGVASELEQLTREHTMDGRPVRVRRVRDIEDLATVHLLFAGGPREARVRELLAAARGPVLTVADHAIGGSKGPVLWFAQEEGRVRFGASLTAAAAHKLRLSAKLLAVAQQVEGR
jgi:hypothetical protein